MVTNTCSNLPSHTDSEISALCRDFIAAMARTEPYSAEWRMAQWSLETTQRERARRLRRMSSGWR